MMNRHPVILPTFFNQPHPNWLRPFYLCEAQHQLLWVETHLNAIECHHFGVWKTKWKWLCAHCSYNAFESANERCTIYHQWRRPMFFFRFACLFLPFANGMDVFRVHAKTRMTSSSSSVSTDRFCVWFWVCSEIWFGENNVVRHAMTLNVGCASCRLRLSPDVLVHSVYVSLAMEFIHFRSYTH